MCLRNSNVTLVLSDLHIIGILIMEARLKLWNSYITWRNGNGKYNIYLRQMDFVVSQTLPWGDSTPEFF